MVVSVKLAPMTAFGTKNGITGTKMRLLTLLKPPFVTQQVQALGEVWCRTAVTHKPAAAPPARVNAALHPAAPDMLRTAVLLLSWLSGGARWVLGAVDRQNATGMQRDLKVSVLMKATYS